jgi:hypothetical protein
LRGKSLEPDEARDFRQHARLLDQAEAGDDADTGGADAPREGDVLLVPVDLAVIQPLDLGCGLAMWASAISAPAQRAASSARSQSSSAVVRQCFG